MIDALVSAPITFVLVHGSWHGSWCWNRLVPLLENKGYRVLTPTLTGHAERGHLLSPMVNCSTHIEDIVRLIDFEDATNVILVGHSYGGMVASGAASRRLDRIRRVVYFDAHVPGDGQSMCDLIGEETTNRLKHRVEQHGFGWILPPSPASIFGTNGEDAAWIDSMATPMSWACYDEQLKLQSSRAVPRAYLRCGRHDRHYFESAAEQIRNEGSPVQVLAAAHNAMITHPKLVAEALIAFSEEGLPKPAPMVSSPRLHS